MLPYEKSPNHYQTGEQRKVDLPILKKENLLNNQIMAQNKLIHQIMYFRIGIKDRDHVQHTPSVTPHSIH